MNQDRETLGQFLKRERELHLVSAQEIALSAHVRQSFIDALEEDYFDAFSKRSQVVWLIKNYAAYLGLNQKEVMQRFELQWRLYGGVKRFPKLSYFPDGRPALKKSGRLKVKGTLLGGISLGGLPKMRLRLPLIIMVLIVGFVLLIYQPGSKQDNTAPEPSPPAETERKTAPLGSHILPPDADAGKTNPSFKDVPAPAPDTYPAHPVAEKKTLAQPKSAKVIGNSDSKRYHLPGMKYYEHIKAHHRVVFRSEKGAINAGYRKARE